MCVEVGVFNITDMADVDFGDTESVVWVRSVRVWRTAYQAGYKWV